MAAVLLQANVATRVGTAAQDPSADRDTFFRVPEVLAAMALEAGGHAADVGAGDGFFTVRMARLVGPRGRVIAEDVDEKALAKLRERIVKEPVPENVETVLGQPNDPKLPEHTLDAVLVCNAYHEMTEHDAMLSHIYRALRNGGRLVLLEPFHETARGKSRDAQVANHDLAPEFAEEELRRAGFTVLERRDGFVGFIGQPGGFWLIIAIRPDAEPPQRK